jgi:hypothetical protein
LILSTAAYEASDGDGDGDGGGGGGDGHLQELDSDWKLQVESRRAQKSML